MTAFRHPLKSSFNKIILAFYLAKLVPELIQNETVATLNDLTSLLPSPTTATHLF